MDNQTENLAARVSMRPVVMPDDENFLFEIYRSTREDLEILPMDDGQKNMILQMQYEAQKQQYAWQFPNALHRIVLLDENPIGRFIFAHETDELRAINLSLLPPYRSLGVGTILLRDLLDEAAQSNRIFSLHVEKTNRAARLYARLGLFVTEDTGTHFKMEWRPPAAEIK